MNLFTVLLSKLSSLFHDGVTTSWSAMRFVFIYSHVLSTTVILGAWLGLSLAQQKLLPVDSSIIVLYSSLTVSGYAAKYAQKRVEKPTETKDSDPEPDAEPQVIEQPKQLLAENNP